MRRNEATHTKKEAPAAPREEGFFIQGGKKDAEACGLEVRSAKSCSKSLFVCSGVVCVRGD